MTLPAQTNAPPRVLVIAGSDSGGGAGIQADIKSIMANGGYAMTAVTAVTVQNTQGVFDVHPVPVRTVVDQMRAVASDIGADVIKTGMLGDPSLIEAIAEFLFEHLPSAPRVIDPVMVATSGDRLLSPRGIDATRRLLVPGAACLTPNSPEAEILTGKAVENLDGQRRAAEKCLNLGAKGVLIKGGHIGTEVIIDVLQTEQGEQFFEYPRLSAKSTHGTGCTLASAIAAHLAAGASIETAVAKAGDYLHEAIRTAMPIGEGTGPVNHGWRLSAMDAA